MKQVLVRVAIGCVPSQMGSPRGSRPGLPLIVEKLPERAARIFWIEPHTSSVHSANAGTESATAKIGTRTRSFMITPERGANITPLRDIATTFPRRDVGR